MWQHDHRRDAVRMTGSGVSRRLCLSCGATDTVGAGQPVWPPGWSCPACGASVKQTDGIPIYAPDLADTVSGFDPVHFQQLVELESKHFWFVARSELIVGLADRYFPDARRLLEVGCGNGGVLRQLAASRHWERLVGSDLHPSGLINARARLPDQVELVQMDARHIPALNTFDLTGAFDVLEHIADDVAVLRGLRQAAQLGGGIIVTVPQHPWLWSSADDIAYHQRRYCRGELERKMERNGFEVLFSSSYTALLLPFFILSRLTSRRADTKRMAREFAINPHLNAVLTAVTRLETRVTLRGLTWPVGGSRIVVGRAI